MDPILQDKLNGIGTPYTGTNMERNELIGLIRRMIKENKYTVDYLLNYAQSNGYQYQMASDIFEELTGMNPKILVNNNEYYQNPVFVPSMTLAWGYKKATKTEAYYIVPFEYGYGVMYKNEKDNPEMKFEYISIDEAVNKLKTLVTKVFTINKIITDNCLENNDIQLNSNTVHNVNNPYYSTPLQELKQSYINKVIDQSQFEKKAFRLVAEEKITTSEAEDAMKWLDELQKERDIEEYEDVEFGNLKNDNKMNIQEENKQLEGSLEFEDIVDEIYTTIGDEYADKNALGKIYNKNKSFFKGLNKEQAAQRLYELYLGFSQDDIRGKEKYVKKSESDLCDSWQANPYASLKKKANEQFIIYDKDTGMYISNDDLTEFKDYAKRFNTIEEAKDEINTRNTHPEKFYSITNYNINKINASLKKKAKNWVVKINVIKEMQDLEKWIDENGEFDAESDTPEEFINLVEKFCDKLFIYKDEIEEKTSEDVASEFDDIVTELKYDGPNSVDNFNYILDNLYDFCDYNSIWLETYGKIEASLKKKAKIILEQIDGEGYYLNGKKGDYGDFNYDGKYKQTNYYIFIDKQGRAHRVWEFAGKLQASLKKKAADEDIELEDIEDIEDKDIIKDTIDEINDTDFNNLVNDITPEQYLEEESKNDQVIKINEKVNKIIDEFTSKFEEFTKYKLQLNTYKLQILNQGNTDTKLKPIEDDELNAQAIVQIIITIAPVENLNNTKKGLAIFSINKDKVSFNGVIRMRDGFVAFSEDGFDAAFEDDKQAKDEIENLI